VPDIKASVREALVTLIESIPDSGSVYNRAKFSTTFDKFLDQFSWVDQNGRNQVRGWWLSIPTMPTVGRGTYDQDSEICRFPIRGIMSYRDGSESEIDFEDLSYRVFRVLQKSTGLAVTSVNGDRVVVGNIITTMPINELRQFGSILCHYCEIHFQVEFTSIYV
jgi:hypothetical protein